MNKRLGTLLVISIVLHLGLLFLITSPAFRRFVQQLQPAPTVPPPPPSLTMLKMEAPPKQPPLPTQFVPTLPSQEVAQADPNAILESERNTALKSREAAKDPNSPLPSLTGSKKAAFNYQDTPPSPKVDSTPSQPVPPTPPTPQTPPTPKPPTPQQPQKPTPPTPPTPPVPKAEPVTPMNAKPEPNLPPPDFNTIPVTPPPVETKTPGDKDKEVKSDSKPTDTQNQTPPPPQQQQQQPQKQQPDQQAQQPPQPQQPPEKPTQPQQASPPPSTPTFAQSRSEMDGSAPQFGDPSPESKATDIGRYKAKLYKMIGSRWYLNVEKSMSMLSVGEVHIKFYVQANGVIDPKSIEVEDGGNSDILETISRDAVKQAYGEPFTDSMRQQLGDGYWEDITFTIY